VKKIFNQKITIQIIIYSMEQVKVKISGITDLSL
jgi:hypothetical protein